MQTTISPVPLGAELTKYRMIRERLLADHPELDDRTLSDTLEGISDLREMIAEVTRSALDDEAMVAGLSVRLSDMKSRLDRFEARAKRKRQMVLSAMIDADIAKLPMPDFTVSLRQAAPSLEVTAEDRIPPAYWKPQPPKLDKQGLLAALKAGAEIDGVGLAPPQIQLSVRTV